MTPRTRETSVTINRLSLVSGKECVFRVLATSGVRTGSATSKPISIMPKAVEVGIAGGRATVTRGDTTTLRVSAFSPDTGSLPTAGTTWVSDRDGVVGRGGRLLFRSLALGEHRITANVPDGSGGYCTATTEMTVAPRRIHSTYHRHNIGTGEVK